MIVQIVRFKDGLDVITGINQDNNQVELSNPMMFQVKNSSLMLQNWLPLAVMKGDTVTVDKTEILCTMNPNDDFTEYYLNMVQDLKKEIKQMKKERELGLDVVEAMAELETIKENNIH